MKGKIIDGLIYVGAVITSPIWGLLLIIIILCLPKNYYEKYDEYRTGEDEMYGW